MRKKTRPGSSYLYKLMYSYGIAFLIVFIIYAISNTAVINEIKKVYRGNYDMLLENSRNNIDNKILTVTQLASFIASDNEMVESFARGGSSEFEYEDFRRREYLRKVSTILNIADEVYIYNPRRGRIISSSTTVSAEKYFDSKHRTDDFTYEEWLEILNVNHRSELMLFGKRDMQNVSEADSSGYIAYLSTLSVSDTNDDVTLVILIDTDRIIDSLAGVGVDENYQFAVLDRKGRPMISIGNVVDTERLDTLSDGDYRFGGDKYSVSVMNSAAVSWKYIMISRASAVLDKQTKLNMTTIFCMLLFAAVSIVLTYIISKKNYRPVERLVDIMNVDENESNEFSAIENKISEMHSDYSSLVKSNEKNFYSQRDEYFKRVIEGIDSADEEMFDADTMKNYGFEFDSERFGVLLVRIKNPRVFVEMLDMTLDMAQYAMKNVVLELAETAGIRAWACTIRSNVMGVLLNFSPKYPDYAIPARDISAELAEVFAKYYSAELLCAIGGEVNSAEEIKESYRQALKAENYALVLDLNETIFYSELANKNEDYLYTTDSERKIIAALKSGDFDKCKELMDELYDSNVASHTRSASAVQLFMLELYRTLSGVLAEAPSVNFADPENMSAGVMYNKMLKSVAEHCGRISNRRQRSVGDKVREYIEENYGDENLSVSLIGDFFGLTPSYLSKLFKDETGETILNYIHFVRIKHAEEFLRSGKSVEKTAQLVGYTNVNSFTRVYKKLTGITPRMTNKQ